MGSWRCNIFKFGQSEFYTYLCLIAGSEFYSCLWLQEKNSRNWYFQIWKLILSFGLNAVLIKNSIYLSRDVVIVLSKPWCWFSDLSSELARKNAMLAALVTVKQHYFAHIGTYFPCKYVVETLEHLTLHLPTLCILYAALLTKESEPDFYSPQTQISGKIQLEQDEQGLITWSDDYNNLSSAQSQKLVKVFESKVW